ncbi:DUF340 domain-containing protein [Clostridium sp. JS66]|uniref:DUF340 domain-containing protein n=1 Tax=Clostridium sp. JS66 TaxID=3064705 RepID=UPI00298E6439|nr:DUF340 domain-containing protein [Clostridium sp. JS66]WPC40319.1 DUF340 domain-containing protein [Clostridium sp. JS66]
MKLKNSIFILVLIGILSLVGNLIGYKTSILASIPGMLILVGISIAGILLAKIIPVKIPAVAYVVTLGCIITYPAVPGSAIINSYISKVNFLALTTPILAYVGISIGNDLESFAKSGWRIILVSCLSFIGTFLGSSLVAQLVLKLTGQI